MRAVSATTSMGSVTTVNLREQRPGRHLDSTTGPKQQHAMPSQNSFGARATLTVEDKPYTIYRLDALKSVPQNVVERLPFSLKILLENLLRNEDGAFVKKADVEAMARWDVTGKVE